MDGSMGCNSYMTQVWLKATYDMNPMWCIVSFESGYGWFPWHDCLKMIVLCQYEVGVLVTPEIDERE